MKRLAADVLTVLCLAGLTLVVTLWARSYFLADRAGSYHDLPAPPPGARLNFDQRAAWRTCALWSHRGRLDAQVTTTTVTKRTFGEFGEARWLP